MTSVLQETNADRRRLHFVTEDAIKSSGIFGNFSSKSNSVVFPLTDLVLSPLKTNPTVWAFPESQ